MRIFRNYCLLFFLPLFLTLSCKKAERRYVFDGTVQGSYYHIILYCDDTTGLRKGFDSIFDRVDATLSLWNKKSLLTCVNNNEDVELNDVFRDNFRLAKQIYEITNGALDISVGPVVQAYGFANKSRQHIEDGLLDSLSVYVGMDKLEIKDNKLKKQYPQTCLDFNAVAQGYTADRIALYLTQHGVNNFIADIGGEIYCKGNKPNGEKWSVGIEMPSKEADSERTFDTSIKISNKGVVTSGNYRKFYVENGIKYSHTIDPRTCRSVRHSLLSATVIANDAITADGLATSFMVMGLQKTKEFLSENKQYSAYLIYCDENGKMKTWYSEEFKQYLDD